jgi:hypothetical protein
VGLPRADEAQIDEAKILGYLLSATHVSGKSKAAFFQKNGFSAKQWHLLAAAVRSQAKNGTMAHA